MEGGSKCGGINGKKARYWSLDVSLKLKNVFGYGDNLYSSLSYDWDQTTEISTGVSLPKFMRLVNPVMAHLSLLSQIGSSSHLTKSEPWAYRLA
ncbi:hypothetical protein Tco_0855897 [Tanacetum coccineum]